MNPPTTTRRYYPGITLFKVCGAILVVLAHVAPLWKYGAVSQVQTLKYMAPFSIVVPCFYVVSGFLVCTGWMRAANPRSYLKTYVARIGSLYVALVLLYVVRWLLPELADHGVSSLSALAIGKRIVTDFLFGPEAFLWFVPALLLGLVVTYWLVQKRLLNKAMPFLAVGFLLCMCVNGTLRTACAAIPGYAEFTANKWVQYGSVLLTNYWGYGLTFVALGVMIAKHEGGFGGIRLAPLAMLCAGLTLAELVALRYGAAWSGRAPLCLSVVPNSLLLFRGMLGWQSSASAQHHQFWNLFSAVAYLGHYPLLQVDQLALGVGSAPGDTLRDTLTFLAILGECLACTLIAAYWMRTRGADLVAAPTSTSSRRAAP